MKKLLVFLKGYKKETILAPLFKLLEASFELFVPLVVSAIIDTGIGSQDNGYVTRMSMLLVALGLIGLVCAVTAQYFSAKAAVGFAAELRHALFAHIQSLSFTEMDTIGTSTLITRLTSDINQIQSGVNLVLRLFLRSPFIVFGAMIMAFTVDVKAALVFVVAIPLLSVVVFGIMLYTMPLYKKVQAGLDKVLGITRENLTGARVIRAFNKEEEERARFEESNEALTGLQKFVGKISSLMNPVTYVIVNGAIIALIYIGAIRVDSGALTQGEVVALTNYMSQILVELVKLANLIITVTKAVACGNRVAAVLDIESSMRDPADGAARAGATGNGSAVRADAAGGSGSPVRTGAATGGDTAARTWAAAGSGMAARADAAAGSGMVARADATAGSGSPARADAAAGSGSAARAGLGSGSGSPVPAGSAPAVAFNHVTLTYKGAGAPSLTDISFTANRGETIGIIGGTGSGKSSLVNLIPRFYDATEGAVLLNGINVKEQGLAALRSRIGVVLQKAVLFKGTIAENLRWGQEDASDTDLWKAIDVAQARDFVEQKDGRLDFFVEQGGKNLSGGQKQRLTIARALVRNPEILILDDSASALDFATDARLRKAIREMDSHPTVFIVSQRTSSIQHADKIIVLDDGKMAGIGTHSELLESCPAYQEIYYSQFKKEAAGL